MASVLKALHRALEGGDQEALYAMADTARRVMGQTSPRGGRRADRAVALDELTEAMEPLLTRSSRICGCRGCQPKSYVLDVLCASQIRPARLTPPTPEDIALTFLVQVSRIEPLAHELRQLGRLRAGGAAHMDLAARAAIVVALARVPPRRDGEWGVDAEGVTRICLKAIGYPVRNPFGYRNTRIKRGNPRTDSR
ncbi:MAG TPA: hypothetical protein VKZ18_28810 [Polyangia bacterium]|nr:hypothetical protein [Polyangia bacterium]